MAKTISQKNFSFRIACNTHEGSYELNGRDQRGDAEPQRRGEKSWRLSDSETLRCFGYLTHIGFQGKIAGYQDGKDGEFLLQFFYPVHPYILLFSLKNPIFKVS